jgi:hypothetical protein
MHNKNMILSILVMLVVSCTGPAAFPSPIPSPTIVPSSTPTHTSTPTEIPPTATLTGTPVPGGPCDNPIVPLVTGNQWSYLVTGEKNSYSFDLGVGEREDVGNINIDIELIDHARNRDLKELVVCRDGAIDNFPLYFMSMLLSDYLDGIINTYKKNGQYAPAYSEFAQSNWILDWQPRYMSEEQITISNPAGDGSFTLLRESPIDLFFTTEGKFEPVTVPGGSFQQALVVTTDYSMEVTVLVQGVHGSGTLVIYTTQWVVPYLGLVRAELTSASMSFVKGQADRMPVHSVLELVKFVPGN